MKRLILALLLLFGVRLTAQELVSCTQAAAEASTIIDSVQLLLAEGNTLGASTLLDVAQTMLDTCDSGTSPVAPTTQASPSVNSSPNATATSLATLAATATPSDAASSASTASSAVVPTLASTSTLASSPSQTITSGNYTLTAPAIDVSNSIAFVRFAHTSVDAGPLDIYMGEENLLVVSNLAYGEATDFVTINAGERAFRARRAGAGADSEVLYRVSWNYLGNSSWIVTAAGLLNDFAFIVEPLSVIRNDYGGDARVRVVNLVAGGPRLTVSTDRGQVLGDGLRWVGFKDTMLDEGGYILEVSSSDGGSLPEAMHFYFVANTTYTLYVIGRGSPEQPLQILNIVSEADLTHVLFRNNSGSSIDLYYRPGNERLIQNLGYGIDSFWISLFSGAYTFVSYAPNTGPRGQELAAIAIQLRPHRYLVFELSGNQINVVYEGLQPPN